jgi:hypothetical protein
MWGSVKEILNVFKVLSIPYKFFSFALNKSLVPSLKVTQYAKKMSV